MAPYVSRGGFADDLSAFKHSALTFIRRVSYVIDSDE